MRRIINEAEKLAKEAKESEVDQSTVREPPNTPSGNIPSEEESLHNQKLVDEPPTGIPEIKIEAARQNQKVDKRFFKKKRR